jgi:repressor LexA
MKPGRPADGKTARDRLDETYHAIVGFIERESFPPTVRQLGKLLGLSSSSSVKERLDALVRAGMIETVPGSPRAIILKEVAEPGGESVRGSAGTSPGSAPNEDYQGADHE